MALSDHSVSVGYALDQVTKSQYSFLLRLWFGYLGVSVLLYDPAYVELLYAESLRNRRAMLTDA